MTQEFNPYHKWLGISPDAGAPTHYSLLGISPSELDPEVIRAAVLRQSTYVRQFQVGQYAKEAAQILNEISAAGICLSNPAKRAEYDANLNGGVARPAPRPPKLKRGGTQRRPKSDQTVSDPAQTDFDHLAAVESLNAAAMTNAVLSPRPLGVSRPRWRKAVPWPAIAVIGVVVAFSIVGLAIVVSAIGRRGKAWINPEPEFTFEEGSPFPVRSHQSIAAEIASQHPDETVIVAPKAERYPLPPYILWNAQQIPEQANRLLPTQRIEFSSEPLRLEPSERRGKARPSSLMFSADGSLLLTTTGDHGEEIGELHLWDVRAGKEYPGSPSITGSRPGAFLAATFVHQDTEFVAIRYERASGNWGFERFRVSPDRLEFQGSDTISGTPGQYFSWCLSPDGERMALGSMGQIDVIRFRPRRERIVAVSSGQVSSLAFSPDGTDLAALIDGALYCWKIDDFQQPPRCIGRAANPDRIAFVPDGSRLIILAREEWTMCDRLGRVLAIGRAKPGRQLAAMALSANENHMVVGDPGGDLLVYSGREARPEIEIMRSGEISLETLALSADGRRVALGTTDGIVLVWDLPMVVR